MFAEISNIVYEVALQDAHQIQISAAISLGNLTGVRLISSIDKIGHHLEIWLSQMGILVQHFHNVRRLSVYAALENTYRSRAKRSRR